MKTRMFFCIGMIFGTLLIPISLFASNQPNIVVILSDDFGYGCATCYGADPSLVRTPNIDRLANEGRRFIDAYTTSSVCSPTRYSLLTGRYCWRTSLKHEVLGATSPLHIEPGRLNLASLLKKHGYSTAAVGKWHLGYGDSPKADYTKELKPGPLEIGFDYHFGVPSNHGDTTGVYVENHKVYGLRSDRLSPGETGKNFKDQPYFGLDAPHRVDEEVMPFITTKAVEWIEKQSTDKPFFLYFTPVAVHNPVTPSGKTKGTSKAGPYGDWIHELDLSVGRVLETLDRKGFAENTLVLFTSDNGSVFHPEQEIESTEAFKAGLKVSGPFRGGKHDVWEGGFHVPYLVRWPGHVPEKSVCDETLSLADTLASISALVGEPLPSVKVAAEDSYNMLPAWLGQKYSGPIRPDIILHSADGNYSIRRGSWKWIEGDFHPDTKMSALRQRADQFKSQLYNIKEDTAETKDVAYENPEKAAQLKELLNRYCEGGYSRELPPLPPPPAKISPLLPVSGDPVYQALFNEVPEKPWTVVRGRWKAKNGELYGTQEKGDRIGAAIRMPLKVKDFDVHYKVSCPIEANHVLRIQSNEKDTVFLIIVSPRHFSVLRQIIGSSGKLLLANEKISITPGEWSDLRIQFRGDEVAVQLGETTVRAKDSALDAPKRVMALMVNGSGVRFKDLKVFGDVDLLR